jgi:hypothetical protein
MELIHETFEVRHHLSLQEATTTNLINGSEFSNGILEVSFFDILELQENHAWIRANVEGPGIKATLYTEKSELDRLLGLDSSLFTEDFIEYLFKSNCKGVGLSLENLEQQISPLNTLVAKSILKCKDTITEVYIDIASLQIEKDLVDKRPSELSPETRLSLELNLYETYMTAEEIRKLAPGDAVLIYRK